MQYGEDFLKLGRLHKLCRLCQLNYELAFCDGSNEWEFECTYPYEFTTSDTSFDIMINRAATLIIKYEGLGNGTKVYKLAKEIVDDTPVDQTFKFEDHIFDIIYRDLPDAIKLKYNGDRKDNWRIVAAANKHVDTGLVVVGARHFDSNMRGQIFAINGHDPKICADPSRWGELDLFPSPTKGYNEIQGFVDNYGCYCSRREAFIIAEAAGQLGCGHHQFYGSDGELFSEHIY